jgi:hypothetical protein
MSEITHEQIYERLIKVESKIDSIDTNTKGIVDAFNSVQGAFKVLEWIAKASQPIIWIVGLIGVVYTAISTLGNKH